MTNKETIYAQAMQDYWNRRSGTDRRAAPAPRQSDGTNQTVTLDQMMTDIRGLGIPGDADVIINGIPLRERGIEYDPDTNTVELTVDFNNGGNAA